MPLAPQKILTRSIKGLSEEYQQQRPAFLAMPCNLKGTLALNILLVTFHSVYAAPLVSSSAAAVALLVPSSLASAPPVSATVAPAPEDPNEILWTDTSNIIPEAQRGSLGATVLGPQNIPLELQNADMLAPPSTDSGSVYVLSCSLTLPSSESPYCLTGVMRNGLSA